MIGRFAKLSSATIALMVLQACTSSPLEYDVTVAESAEALAAPAYSAFLSKLRANDSGIRDHVGRMLAEGTFLESLPETGLSATQLTARDRSRDNLRASLSALQSISSDSRARVAAQVAAARTPQQRTEAALGAFALHFHASTVRDTSYELRKPEGAAFAGCLDIIGSQAFYDLAAASVANQPEAYVGALEKVKNGIDCETMANARVIARTFTYAWGETLRLFPAAERDHARRALAAMLVNPALLIHDATKWAGPTPIMRWLSHNMPEFRDTLRDGTSSISHAGLWLKDPRTSRLVRLGPLVEESRVSVLARDEFADAAQRPLWTTIDLGGAAQRSSWTYSGGQFVQTNKALDASTATAQPGAVSLRDIPEADYEVSATIQYSATGAAGLIARYRDAYNYYRLSYEPSRQLLSLTRVAAGRITSLASQTVTLGSSARLSLRVTGTKLAATANGKPVLQVTDAAPLASGRAGLYTWNATAAFSGFLVGRSVTSLDSCETSALGLLDFFTDRVRLGLGLCAGVEVARGCFNPELGYACTAGLCEGQLAADATRAGRRAFQYRSAGVPQNQAGAQSPFGIGTQELSGLLCDGAHRGTSRDIQSGLGAYVDGGSCRVAGAGLGNHSRALECLVTAVASTDRPNGFEGSQMMDYVSRNRGESACGNPLAAAPSSIGEALGRLAERAAQGAASGLLAVNPKSFLAGYASGLAFGVRDIAAEAAALEGQLDAQNQASRQNLEEQYALRKDKYASEISAIDARIRALTEQMQKDANDPAKVQALQAQVAAAVAEREAAKKKLDEVTEQEAKAKADGSIDDGTQCTPESGNCDVCSPTAALLQATRACGDQVPEPFAQRGGLVGGGVIDPVPPTSDQAGSAARAITGCAPRCDGAGANAAVCGGPTSTACGTLDCPEGRQAKVVNGACVCAAPGVGEFVPVVRAACYAMRCADGEQAIPSSAGQCVCGGARMDDPRQVPGGGAGGVDPDPLPL